MPTQVELCELVTKWLNRPEQQEALPETFTAEHISEGFIDQPEAGRLYVSVLAGERANDRFSRTQWEKQAEVVVSIVEKINKRTEAGREERAREMRTLHEALEDLLLGVSFEEFDRNEEVGQSLPGQFGREGLYDASVFNADLPMVFTRMVDQQRG